MRVFLAGATGVLGRQIVPLLVADGHRVSALVRPTRRDEQVRALGRCGVDVVEGDALDAIAVRRAVRAATPDVVMHQLTDLRSGTSASNAVLRRLATAHLVDAATAFGVGRVVAQSIAWAYRPTDAPAGEEVELDLDASDPARRTTVRAVADLEDALPAVPEWVALRFGMLYGPDTWFAPSGARAADAAAGRLVADDTVTSFVHVEDAARAAVDALHWPTGAVNVCDDEPAPARVWLPVFCAAVGAPPPPSPGGPPPTAARSRGADNRLARRRGWSPCHPTWREGFRTGLGDVHLGHASSTPVRRASPPTDGTGGDRRRTDEPR